MRFLLLLATVLVVACGRAGLTVPASARQSPTDCAAVCEASSDQLVKDFGIPAQDIHCQDPGFRAATTCQTCQAEFARAFGVSWAASCQ